MTPPCLPSDATSSSRVVRYTGDSPSVHEVDFLEEDNRPVVSDPNFKENTPEDQVENDANAAVNDSPQQQQQPMECNKCLSDSSEDGCDRPSNAKLLGIAFVSFLSFAVIQMVFALIAGSQAMVGDSTAMIVDSVTYFLNWLAERRKTQLKQDEEALLLLSQQQLQVASSNSMVSVAERRRILERTRRKEVLKLEIAPPIVSVIPLVVVTIFVLQQSIVTLHASLTNKLPPSATTAVPNVNIMLAFGLTNLFLDFLNVFCFARAKHMCGFQTRPKYSWQRNNDNSNDDTQEPALQAEEQSVRDEDGMEEKSSSSRSSTGPTFIDVERQQPQQQQLQRQRRQRQQQRWRQRRQRQEATEDGEDDLMTHLCPNDCKDSNDRNGDEDDDCDDHDHANLNMCSACTHVFADTLRSLAMILAVMVNKLFPETFTPDEADASAALLVSILIAVSLIPLFRGLFHSCSELIKIQREEKSEKQRLEGRE